MTGPTREPMADAVADPEKSGDSGVAGERGTAAVNRVRSLQSRASNLLAGGLTMVLGVAALTWYYSNALSRSARRSETAQSSNRSKAQGEMPLPSLGHIDLPIPPALPEAPPPHPQEEAMARSAVSAAPQSPPLLASVSSFSPAPALAQPPSAAHSAAPAAKTPEELAVQRRLAGAVFVRDSETGSLPPSATTAAQTASALAMAPGIATASEAPASETPLAAALRPTPIAAARARVMPTRRFLLPKGAFIDCTLETAIDSTLPGMTTCVTATDTFSADGSVVLLERGTKLIGETRGQVQQGTARVFVLWAEARTPAGIVVPLDSPGTDELGRAGLSGEVDRHFWDRFGAAILVSTIDGAVQGAAQSGGGSTVVLNPTGSQEVLTEILKSTVNIPPTVTKKNGERIEVLVARDVDFRSVYELR